MYLCSIYLLSPLVERIYFNFEPHSHCLNNLKFYVNARNNSVFFCFFYLLYNTTIVCIIPMKIAKFNIFTLNLN